MKLLFQIVTTSIATTATVGGLSAIAEAAALTNRGLVTSQADIAMKANVARSQFGVDGTGITIGVISDSFNNLGGAATDVASGDLPSGINVLKDLPSGGSDEGRAMMQLMHDVAPGANFSFYTGFQGLDDFANGVRRLAEAGADIIVDDVYDDTDPMFQDGLIAQAIDEVVADGVAYFSAAGNYGRNAYESAFNPSGRSDRRIEGELHDFDPGLGIDTFQGITIPEGDELRVSFQWDSPYFSVNPDSGGATNDLDIFLLDRTLTNVLASSTNNNLGGDPLEVLSFVNDGSLGTEQFNLAIAKSSGADPGLMKYVIFGFLGSEIAEFNTNSGALFGHANARGAQAVGAALYLNTPAFGTDPATIEPFSSAGPTPILFDKEGNRLTRPEIRWKPEIVAPDGTNTTFFGQFDLEGDGFLNFLGSSAAAPHAAAVAALMLEASPGTSPYTIYSMMERTALDMGTPGFDFESGFGLIQADRAVRAVISVPEPHSLLGVLMFGALAAGSFLKRNTTDALLDKNQNNGCE